MKKHTGAKLALDTAHYAAGIIEMLDNTETCLHCGTKLKYIADKDKRRNRGYCSLDCYYRYPPKMAHIANAYGKPVKEVIVNLLNSVPNKNVIAELLGIQARYVY